MLRIRLCTVYITHGDVQRCAVTRERQQYTALNLLSVRIGDETLGHRKLKLSGDYKNKQFLRISNFVAALMFYIYDELIFVKS